MPDDQSVLSLATIRRNRGISLEQIAAATKISVRSLDAIERGDFKKLPGGIYNTNYIRQYARAIDYDETAILMEYQRLMGVASANANTSRQVRGIFGSYLPASSGGN